MEIELKFNPNKPKNSKVMRLFQNGGVMLKFWLLFKSQHIVDQKFTEKCLKLADIYEQMICEKKHIMNIDQFIEFIGKEFNSPMELGRDYQSWIVKYWDYFNHNINKKVVTIYKYYENREIETRSEW